MLIDAYFILQANVMQTTRPLMKEREKQNTHTYFFLAKSWWIG